MYVDYFDSFLTRTFPSLISSSLIIITLRKPIVTLPIMCNNRTVLRTIPINTPNHHAVRSWTSSTISASLFNRKLEVRAGTGEREAFVVFVLMWVAVVADGFTVVVVVYCGDGCIVDVGLGVFRSWG